MRNNDSKQIKIIPEHYTSVTPWIISPSSADLIEFMKAAFEAEEIPKSRVKNEAGIIINVVVQIGNARVKLFDAREGWDPTPSFLNVYVEDIEKTYQKALQLGATSVTNITAMYFGEKVCRILDPFGNLWWLTQRIEDIEADEIGQRASTPEAVRGVVYIQKSLDEALKSQKEFFKNKAKN
jgi:uncharacterized glyoxalase superfamily protein PhnB